MCKFYVQKKKKKKSSHVYNAWFTKTFYQDCKIENLFFESVLSSRSEITGPVTRSHVKSSLVRNETPLQLSMLFLHTGTGIIFLVLRSKNHQCF